MITVRGDNIEAFMDEVISKAAKGYVRVDTMELSLGIQTNYWVMTMTKPEVEVAEPEVKKAGRPAKNKDA